MSDKEDEQQEQPTGPVDNAWALKIPEFKKGDMKSHLLEESSFSIMFPKYREKYIKESWPLLSSALNVSIINLAPLKKYKEKLCEGMCIVVTEYTYCTVPLQEYGLKADLDLMEGQMTVVTTRKTWDPFIIIKARDIIKLLARSVPLEQAIRVLKDDCTCEVIKVSAGVYLTGENIKLVSNLLS